MIKTKYIFVSWFEIIKLLPDILYRSAQFAYCVCFTNPSILIFSTLSIFIFYPPPPRAFRSFVGSFSSHFPLKIRSPRFPRKTAYLCENCELDQSLRIAYKNFPLLQTFSNLQILSPIKLIAPIKKASLTEQKRKTKTQEAFSDSK